MTDHLTPQDHLDGLRDTLAYVEALRRGDYHGMAAVYVGCRPEVVTMKLAQLYLLTLAAGGDDVDAVLANARAGVNATFGEH